MNFGLDLATIEETRKKELKQRVLKLRDNVIHACRNMRMVKVMTDKFPQQLAKSQKMEYKKRFMTYMYDLDKYMYLIVQFNYLCDNLEIHNIVPEAPKTPYLETDLIAADLETTHLETADLNMSDLTTVATPISTSAMLVKNYFKPDTPDLHSSNETLNSSFSAPVLDTSNTEGPRLLTQTPKNLSSLFDFLSEPIPSTSQASSNNKEFSTAEQQKQQNEKHNKKEVRSKHISGPLISFTTDSCSSSCTDIKEATASEQDETTEEEPVMAAQTTLQLDTNYVGIIMHVDGPVLWIVIDNNMFSELLHNLNEYYDDSLCHFVNVTRNELLNMQLCAYFDEKNNNWYRCFVLHYEEGSDLIKLFLLDSGYTIIPPLKCMNPCQTKKVDCPIINIQPLAKEFCRLAPLARCCHLEHLDFSGCSPRDMDALSKFMDKFEHSECTVHIEDNNSESLGVVVTLADGTVLNDVLVEQGMATWMEGYRPGITQPSVTRNLPPAEEIDITDCPEYEDALEAVTGYHNRDEEVICRAFKGEENNMCFKGTRCKKKHIGMHPDGWTLDKVQAVGNIPALPLPKPGTWVNVRVTAVVYFNRVYVQLVEEDQPEPEPLPSFGVVLPPTTLEALVEDMNCPSTIMAYKPFKLTPAQGEYVVALYPPDGKWYRCCVLSLTRHDQSLRVRYVDFGTECWVKEADIRHLDAKYLRLPAQAVLCQLAGLQPDAGYSNDFARLQQAEVTLSGLVLNHIVEALVVSRNYDEIEIQLLDPSGFCVAKQLSAMPGLRLVPYKVVDDSNVRSMFIVP